MGMAGSNVSLGADVSTLYSNPAGLGTFNRSVFSLTPAYTWNSTKSTFLTNSNSQSENKFNMFNGGLVISKVRDIDLLWVRSKVEQLCVSNMFFDADIVKLMKEIVPEFVSNNSENSNFDRKGIPGKSVIKV